MDEQIIEEEEEVIDDVVEREVQFGNDEIEEEECQEIANKLYHVLHFVILVSLIASVILILTFGSVEPFSMARFIFIICICTFHVLSIIVKFKKNGEINDPNKFFFLNSDLHYLILLMMYAIADLTPILYVFFYIVTFINGLLLYLSNNTNIFFAENDRKTSKKLKSIASNDFFNNCPAILEMINIFYLLIVSIVRLSIFCLFTLIVFIFDIVMYNYAISKQYSNVWNNSARWVKRNLGCLQPIITLISQLGELSEKIYS